MAKTKNYGCPYDRKSLMERGDLKKIAEATGYSYHTVSYQLNGVRKLQPSVKAFADLLADQAMARIEEILKCNS